MGSALRRVACRLTAQVVFGQDLSQEATIHLSFSEEQGLDSSRSWHLHSCEFELQGLRPFARNIRSCTLRHAEVCLFRGSGDEHVGIGCARSRACTYDDLSARDILGLLALRLAQFETEILTCLLQGIGPREIASRIAALVGRSSTSALPKDPLNLRGTGQRSSRLPQIRGA